MQAIAIKNIIKKIWSTQIQTNTQIPNIHLFCVLFEAAVISGGSLF